MSQLETPWFYQRESVKSLDSFEAQIFKVISQLCHLLACEFGQMTFHLSISIWFPKNTMHYSFEEGSSFYFTINQKRSEAIVGGFLS